MHHQLITTTLDHVLLPSAFISQPVYGLTTHRDNLMVRTGFLLRFAFIGALELRAFWRQRRLQTPCCVDFGTYYALSYNVQIEGLTWHWSGCSGTMTKLHDVGPAFHKAKNAWGCLRPGWVPEAHFAHFADE